MVARFLVYADTATQHVGFPRRHPLGSSRIEASHLLLALGEGFWQVCVLTDWLLW